MNDKDAATAIMDHFDSAVYNIRYVYFWYHLSLNNFMVLVLILSVDDGKHGGCQVPENSITQ